MSSRTRNIAFLTGGRAFANLISLGTLMFLSRLLDKETYGLYQQVWMVYLTLLPFLILGLPSSITFFAPKMDMVGQKRLVLQTGMMLACAGVIIGSINFFGAPWLAAGLGGSKQIPLFRAFLWFPISSLPLLCLDTWLLANGRAKLAAGFDIISESLNFVSIVGPVYLGANLQTVFYTLSVVSLLRLIALGSVLFWTYRSVALRLDWGLVKEQMAYALPLSLATMIGTFTRQLDRWIVAFFFDIKTYAIYVNGARELPLVAIVAGSVMAVVTPEFVRLYEQRNTTELLRIWNLATRKVAILFLPLAAFLMVFAQDTMIVLFSKKYIESTLVFRLYLLLFPLRITVFGSVLLATGNTRTVMKAAMAMLLVDAVLNVVLTPLLGLIGPICATLLSSYMVAALQLYWTAKVLEANVRAVFPWRELGILFLFSCVAAGLTSLFLPLVTGLLARITLGVVVFSGVGIACSRVLPDLRLSNLISMFSNKNQFSPSQTV